MSDWNSSEAFAADASGELDVLGHNGDPLGVDGAQVGVLEKAYHVSFRGFLKGEHCLGLETQVSLDLLGDLSHKSLERKLADQQLSRLLELADLSECDGSGSESVGLLDATLRGNSSGLAGCLVGELLARGLGACVLASGLLGASHLFLRLF